MLAVTIADTFYSQLTANDGSFDTRRSAQALHHAVRAVRDKVPTVPSLWAAYLHAGLTDVEVITVRYHLLGYRFSCRSFDATM